MRYKHFQNAGVEVSSIAVGTWAIGGAQWGEVDRKQSIEAIRTMIDRGVNLVDTAPVYGGGYSEKVVGEALEGIRDKVLISTKCAISNSLQGELLRHATYESIMKEIDCSLANLRTDHVDFYYIHWPDVKTPIEETMRAMNELRRSGKIRFIGVSNFSKEQVEEACKYAQIDVIQPPFSLVDQSQRELMEWADAQGISTMTYGSLGAGILTGAIRKRPAFAPDDYRLTFYDFYREPKFSKCMELLGILDKIAAAHGKSTAQVAINWSTQKEFVGTALIGVRNASEAEENCSAFDWMLTTEELAMIDKETSRLGL